MNSSSFCRTQVQFTLAVIASIAMLTAIPIARSVAAEPALPASLDVRFADAQWRMAQAELDYILDANTKVPESFSKNLIAELRVRVDVARASLDERSKPDGGNRVQIYLVQAQGELKIAELHLATGRRLHEVSPNIVNDLYLKRLELRVEAAQLAIEKVQSPEFQNSEAEQIRWQLAQLQRDMLQLKTEFDKEL